MTLPLDTILAGDCIDHMNSLPAKSVTTFVISNTSVSL